MCQEVYDKFQHIEIGTPSQFAEYMGVTPRDLVFYPPTDWMDHLRAVGWEEHCLCQCDIEASAQKFGWIAERDIGCDPMRYFIRKTSASQQ